MRKSISSLCIGCSFIVGFFLGGVFLWTYSPQSAEINSQCDKILEGRFQEWQSANCPNGDFQSVRNKYIREIHSLEQNILELKGKKQIHETEEDEFYLRKFAIIDGYKKKYLYSLFRKSPESKSGSIVYVDLEHELNVNDNDPPEYILLYDSYFEDADASLVHMDYENNAMQYIVDSMQTSYPEITGEKDYPSAIGIAAQRDNKILLYSRAHSYSDWGSIPEYYYLDLTTKEVTQLVKDHNHTDTSKHEYESGFRGIEYFSEDSKRLAIVVTRKDGFAIPNDEPEFIKIYDVENNGLIEKMGG